MKVILYIGHHKVGSTALQAYLARNWLALARAGILYPSVEAQGFAANLADALRGAPDDSTPVLVREPHSALAYRMIADACDRPMPKQFQGLPATPQMLRALRKQVEQLAPQTVLLCSEAFANFGQVAAAQIDRLCAAFPEAEFQIYCALRRPDDYLTSWHGQRLKVGELAKPLADGGAEQYFGSIHFDYRMVVEEWIKRVPNAKVSLRNYADILAAGGSAEDFVAQTGLTLPEGMTTPGRANASLPLAALPLMERAIADLPPPLVHQLSRYLLKNGKALTPVPNKEVELFGEKQRARILKAFQPTETYLRSVTGQAAFFPDLEHVAATKPVAAQEAARQLLAALDPATLPQPALGDYIKTLKSSF